MSHCLAVACLLENLPSPIEGPLIVAAKTKTATKTYNFSTNRCHETNDLSLPNGDSCPEEKW
jgi:hypothetical protein